MTPPTISIRLVLYIGTNVAGNRLRRADPLPDWPFTFPDTEQGRYDAETALKAYQSYVDKNQKVIR